MMKKENVNLSLRINQNHKYLKSILLISALLLVNVSCKKDIIDFNYYRLRLISYRADLSLEIENEKDTNEQLLIMRKKVIMLNYYIDKMIYPNTLSESEKKEIIEIADNEYKNYLKNKQIQNDK